MARPVTVHIPHSLGQAEARRRIDEGFGLIQKQLSGGMLGLMSFDRRWEADRMHFEGGGLGQKITGRFDILADSVQVQIDLPDLLATLAEKIAGTLKTETQKLLGKK
jgi:hypothetical protein